MLTVVSNFIRKIETAFFSAFSIVLVLCIAVILPSAIVLSPAPCGASGDTLRLAPPDLPANAESLTSVADPDTGSLPERMVVDGSGNVHLLWTRYIEEDTLRLNKTTNVFHRILGSGTVTNVSNETWKSNGRRPDMDVDSNGDLHVVWLQKQYDGDTYQESRILYRKRYTDGTWSDAVEVGPDSAKAPSITVSDNDTAYIAWSHPRPGALDEERDLIYRYCWADTAESLSQWSGTIAMTDTALHMTSPRLIVRGGEMHLLDGTTQPLGPGGQNKDLVEYRYNDDETCHGDTCWTEPTFISDSLCNAVQADMVVDGTGKAHIVYYHL